MEESPRSMRRMLEDGLDCKAQFISMELVMQKISNGWEDSPKMRRAPADELFFRGQLLPLELDPRLQLVHTLSGLQRGQHFEDSLEYKSAVEEELSMKLAYAEAFPFAAADEDGFPLHPGFQEGLSLKSVNEEGSCVQELAASNTRSSRSNGGADALKNDSRSSSFRSQQSSYWGSGEKDSRDSSSSSRCSNGSSQDGCLHAAERRAQQQNKAMASSSRLNNMANANDKVELHADQHGKPPLPCPKVKKWSWKALFTGLRRAAKIRVDDERSQNISQRDAANRQRKSSLFGFGSTMEASRGVERDEYQGQSCYVGSAEMRKARYPQASRGKSLANDDYGGHRYYMGTGGYKGYSYYEGSHGGRPGKEKARLGIIAWNARESWQRWVKRPLSGKLSNTHKQSMLIHEDIHPSFTMKAKSLSSTPLTKSPVRRADNVANTLEFYSAPSSKYVDVGFAASCPASMRSSPHHSGVLAVVNKPPPSSSLHDLHTAIQGAIAHCKQSQSADPP
ncbi:hypothetical protein GOP47_0019716 [Adiantum capillus-veneris]|uniref:Uncharacterized protein n=1 Tax=Adiantum capillus-veneris TaxID=13818 RepID=A0A9D4Z9W4_ADICA|nr:hypothetical protein GOP47_0019716 [Adiantum capillus-veneris]